MTLIPHPTGPGHWSIDRWGASGTRYRLRFHGQRLHWFSRWDTANGGHWTQYRYWRRLWYRIGRDEQQRFGKTITAAFADLGITDPVAYVRARHVRMTVLPPPPPPPPPEPRRRDYLDLSR